MIRNNIPMIDPRKFIIYAYNEMIEYYKHNMGEISKYGDILITEELLTNIKMRKAILTWGSPKWER